MAEISSSSPAVLAQQICLDCLQEDHKVFYKLVTLACKILNQHYSQIFYLVNGLSSEYFLIKLYQRSVQSKISVDRQRLHYCWLHTHQLVKPMSNQCFEIPRARIRTWISPSRVTEAFPAGSHRLSLALSQYKELAKATFNRKIAPLPFVSCHRHQLPAQW